MPKFNMFISVLPPTFMSVARRFYYALTGIFLLAGSITGSISIADRAIKIIMFGGFFMQNIYEILGGIGIEIPEDKKADLNKALRVLY